MTTNPSENVSRRRGSRSGEIAEELRRRIAMGEFAEGGDLPPERKLAAEFSASRVTIAEAFERLTAEGLVTRAAGRGTRVAAVREERAVIRVVHPLHPGSSLIWREGIELLRGVEQTVDRAIYHLERHCYFGDAPPPDRTLMLPQAPTPTVFIEAPVMLHPYMAELDAGGVPFVVANLEYADLPYTATRTDHAAAARQAVKLLADMGHRRIAYVGTAPSHLFYADTHRGYLQGMADASLPVDRELVVHSEATDMPLVLRGDRATRRLLALADPPTAIVTGRDGYAEGAWYAIEELGLDVGHDVSLVGYDDLSWSSLPSPLTTFREPCFDMGAEAVKLLVDRMVNGPQPHQQVTIESELVMRRSTGPVLRKRLRS